ncbi:MAG TPA: hypothetical protein VG435_01460 [Acidimicrobiales bacterium]|nr:hypothetical protein [Acidimicrobiales bacterium]
MATGPSRARCIDHGEDEARAAALGEGDDADGVLADDADGVVADGAGCLEARNWANRLEPDALPASCGVAAAGLTVADGNDAADAAVLPKLMEATATMPPSDAATSRRPPGTPLISSPLVH